MVGTFGYITGVLQPDTARCCMDVRDGSPFCCYSVGDGAELTFTQEEVRLLGVPMVKRRDDSMLVMDRSWWTRERIEISMHNGLLARTLECSSHPTRPVVQDGLVVDVVVVDACNSDIAFDRYVQNSDILLSLWQKAVLELGVKPYYGIPGELKDSWRSVVHITSG
jgi:hypothetical protein